MSEKVYPVPASWKKNAFVDDAAYKKMYAESIKEVAVAIKELPQLSAEEFEEEILLEPVARGLKDFPIPVLSRSSNDPRTWEAADEEEILLF